MIVRHVLLDHVSQMALAEEDEMVQTLVFDRFDKPLGVGIAVRTSGRGLDAFDACRPISCRGPRHAASR